MLSQRNESSPRGLDGCRFGMDHEIREERSPVGDHALPLVVLGLVGVPTMLPRSPAAWPWLPENHPEAKQARDEEKLILSV